MKIGAYTLDAPVILAPMAGVTDRPFRQLCKDFGAGLAVSEMVGAQSLLKGSHKTLRRACHEGETRPVSVQIVGSDPQYLAEAARVNADRGAEIIDINMGCPAKKVCNTLAGSSLLKDEPLVQSILEAVVGAVKVPVTLKIRTGWSPERKNGLNIAKIAEQSGIAALAVHGRTRACMFRGEAEYDTIAEIKSHLKIPVIANGDITSAADAKAVLDYTKADAVMIGRGAQGKPWIFRHITHYLNTGMLLPEPSPLEIKVLILQHLKHLYAFYGEYTGVHIARKHVSWYTKGLPYGASFRDGFNRLETAETQLSEVENFFQAVLEAPHG